MKTTSKFKTMKKSFLTLGLLIGLIPFGLQAQTIDTLLQMNGYKLHFNIIKGNGMPILFESGFGDAETIWDGIAFDVAKITGATVIRYDRQGFGKSTVNPNKKGAENEIIELEKALKQLNFEKEVVLVAHSLGGLYSTLFSARNEEKVKGIIFFDTSTACFFTDEELNQPGIPLFSKELVAAARKNPLPLDIPLMDIVAEKSCTAHESWKNCHEKLENESDLRNGVIAEECSHYVFLENIDLSISAIVTKYAEVQDQERRAVIIEKGFKFQQAEVNKNYGKNKRYYHSVMDLSDWGNSMIKGNKITEGFEILKLATSLYPQDPNSFKGLGEAYFKLGDIKSAALNFQKSYDLDSSSKNSKLMLDKISKVTTVSEEILATYVGAYNFEGMSLEISKDNGMLFFVLNGAKSAMYFTSNSNCFTFSYNFDFTKDKKGNVDGFTLLGDKKAIKIK